MLGSWAESEPAASPQRSLVLGGAAFLNGVLRMNDEYLRDNPAEGTLVDEPADEDEAEATDERGDETKAGTVTVTGAAMTEVDSAALTAFLKSVETFCATCLQNCWLKDKSHRSYQLRPLKGWRDEYERTWAPP